MKYQPQDGFPYYFELAPKKDITALFSSSENFDFLRTIDEEKSSYRYVAGKWSIKQIVGHIADHERIKMSRAFFMSRNISVELWGYDQNVLVENSRFEEMSFVDLLTDLENVRRSSASFVKSLSEKQLNLKGKARQYEISLEDFLKSIIGHEIHHMNIIKERYI